MQKNGNLKSYLSDTVIPNLTSLMKSSELNEIKLPIDYPLSPKTEELFNHHKKGGPFPTIYLAIKSNGRLTSFFFTDDLGNEFDIDFIDISKLSDEVCECLIKSIKNHLTLTSENTSKILNSCNRILNKINKDYPNF